ncbi:hypothetical protein ACFSBZ_03205 [Amnibacterium flavum]|uniref:hypothetical protein n=1 Tax=Amnibacterium flavum TaxID=2173173 RepID=UPI001F0CD9AF|nr:hypothetical protein [Amnibacterium flavum]
MSLRKSFVVAALAATLALAGCSSPSPEPSATGSVVAPVIVTLDSSLDGTTVSLPIGTVLDLSAEDPKAWTGEVADTAIAEFVPGKDDGSAEFNPGIKPISAGTTQVTLTDSASDETIEFTLEVTG